MDQEKLFSQLDKRYASKREITPKNTRLPQ